MSGLSTNAKVAIGAAVGLLVAGGVYFFVSQKKTAKVRQQFDSSPTT